jgi:hypothetical protein
LILKCDFLVSKFGFKFNSYRYSSELASEQARRSKAEAAAAAAGGGGGGGGSAVAAAAAEIAALKRRLAATELAAKNATDDAEIAQELLAEARTAQTPPRGRTPVKAAAAAAAGAGSASASRVQPSTAYASATAPDPVYSAAAATLAAAASAAELLEELKGGLRVSIEHNRQLQQAGLYTLNAVDP